MPGASRVAGTVWIACSWHAYHVGAGWAAASCNTHEAAAVPGCLRPAVPGLTCRPCGSRLRQRTRCCRRPTRRSVGTSPAPGERRLLATPTQRDSGREQPFRTSYISVFGRVLGAYSPYRGLSLPPDLTCFECNAAVHHFGNDCPTRFARVRGETRPGGWPIDGPGGVSKNQAGLLGAYSLYRGLSLSPDLTCLSVTQPCITSATSVRRASLECVGRPRQGGRPMPRRSLQESGRLDRPGSSRTPLAPSSAGSAPVVPHVTHPVTADEIVAPASPAPRRLMPRLAGRRSRRRGGSQPQSIVWPRRRERVRPHVGCAQVWLV